MTYWSFPFRVDGRGRTADTDRESYVRELIEQVLFTALGERVNRPDFGTGLQQLVFAPNSPDLATATQYLVQGALQQWLGEAIVVESVEAASEDASLTVTVKYRLRGSDLRRSATFEREI
jgi:uncharacterized protein